MPTRAYIGLGANLGQARETIEHAIEALRRTPGINAVRVAPHYGSDPVDATGPTFVNTVVEVETTLEPLACLDVLQSIENAHGRERPFQNAPRTLDLDLLWYEGVTMHTPRLILPHPRMHQRAFVLRPLRDLIEDLPLKHGSLDALLDECCDQKVWRL